MVKKEENNDDGFDFLSDLKKGLSKELGKEVVSMIEDGLPSDVKKFISTGTVLLDMTCANRKDGGIPVGKITEIFGHESTGKTLLAMQIAANCQKEGGLVIYIDTEHALSSDFAKRVGLDLTKDFIYMTPSSMEDCFRAMFKVFHSLDELEKNKKMKYPHVVLIWDSIPASPAQEDIDKENPNATANVGLMSRVLSKNLKQFLNLAGRGNVALVFLNQLRTKIGAMIGEDPYNTVGGKSLPYYASLRIKLSSVGKIWDKKKEEVLGISTRAEVKKTRFGPPHRKVDFEIYFTKGVNDLESVVNFVQKKNVLKTKKGGPLGTLFLGMEKDEWMTKSDLKKRILEDEKFKSYLKDLLEKAIVKNLEDPDITSIEIEEGGVSDND